MAGSGAMVRPSFLCVSSTVSWAVIGSISEPAGLGKSLPDGSAAVRIGVITAWGGGFGTA